MSTISSFVHLVRTIFWILEQPAFWYFTALNVVKAGILLATKNFAYRDSGFSMRKLQHTERAVSDPDYFQRIAKLLLDFNGLIFALTMVTVIPLGLTHATWLLVLMPLFLLESHAVGSWWGRMVMREYLRNNQGWKSSRTPAIWDVGITWAWLILEIGVLVRVVLL